MHFILKFSEPLVDMYGKGQAITRVSRDKNLKNLTVKEKKIQ